MDLQEVGLLLGANLGNRYQNLTNARFFLEERLGVALRVSAIYETAAWGGVSTAHYLNQVLVFESGQPPEVLLTHCLSVEQQMGRTRELRWGDRVIDIDILFYGQQQVQQENLIIPHPRLPERAFALKPLAEVAGNWQHPQLKMAAKELLAACGDALAVKIWEGALAE